MIEFTDWAAEIVGKAHEAARRFNPDARIRLAATPEGVQALFAEMPAPGDQEVRVGGVTIYVERGLEGVIDVEEPHDRLVLKPTGSRPNVRGDH